MKKLFLNLFTLLVLLYGFFWILDEVFTRVYKKGEYTKTQWIYKMEGQQFDYAIHGSSRGYTTIDVGDINKATHLKGINLSVDGAYIADQYLTLKLFLEHGNKINHLYLQVDPVSSGTEKINSTTIPKFFPYIKEKEVFNHFKQFGYIWYVYRYVPFYRYAEYNTIWGIHQFLNDSFQLFPKEYDKYGGRFYPVSNYKRSYKKQQAYEFDLTNNYKYLNKVIALCKSKNVKLTLFTAPYSNVAVTEKYKQNVEAFKQMMSRKGVDYINYATIYNNELNMFYDEVHLNKKGVKTFTLEVKENLIEPSFKTVESAFVNRR
ncbi:hypothetical protein [Adhaeribacter pallidiroseus]|uniref:Uncharacterized protein n=1 Tax=Adhaeribacter pallidiroseus TaxID=2072847 RepID=A0A369QKF7_9BACT|nr:hypothetical protein [Adhaeribacter pallidiroseus]RDC65403.1 hypothetical protein AHMF7616_04033 [Adhaeribacter pallidiroseus]